MAQEIIIKGDKVVLQDVIIRSQVHIDEYIKEMSKATAMFTPRGVVFQGHGNNHSVYSVAEPAQTREIIYKQGKQRISYKLAFPPLLYTLCLRVRAVTSFFVHIVKTENVTQLSQKLYLLPLPNFFGNGKVCMGNDFSIETSVTSILGKLSAAIEYFWSATYNTDLVAEAKNNLPPQLLKSWSGEGEQEKLMSVCKEWQRLSEEGSVKFDWIKSRTTLEELSLSLCGGP